MVRFLTPHSTVSSPGEESESDVVKVNPTEDQLVDDQLESLLERANLTSVVSGRENSPELTALTAIVPVSRTDKEALDREMSDDEDDPELTPEPEPPSTELVQEPFAEMESENGHLALFKFLFNPIEEASSMEGQGGPDQANLSLSDELVADLQNLKDRMQHRYNVIKRNLFNVNHYE